MPFSHTFLTLAGKSKTALRREARRQELEDMGLKLAVRMKELEERTNQIRLEDGRREKEFQERMKVRVNEEAKKLQATRDDLNGNSNVALEFSEQSPDS